MEQARAEIMEIFKAHQFFDVEKLIQWENEILPVLKEEDLKEIKNILEEYLIENEEINIKYQLDKEEILKEELGILKEIIREKTHQAVLRMKRREEALREKEESKMENLESQLQNI